MEILDTFIQVSLQILAIVGIWFVILVLVGCVIGTVWMAMDAIR